MQVMFFQVQYLEVLLQSWLDYESNVESLKTWLSTQEERLKRRHKIEDLSSVQNALRDCQVILHVLHKHV